MEFWLVLWRFWLVNILSYRYITYSGKEKKKKKISFSFFFYGSFSYALDLFWFGAWQDWQLMLRRKWTYKVICLKKPLHFTILWWVNIEDICRLMLWRDKIWYVNTGLKENCKLASRVLETRVLFNLEPLRLASHLPSLLSWTWLCHIDLEFFTLDFK